MTNSARFAFLGTPEFAALVLERLIEADMPPSIVICNPDKPTGRKKIITPPPTKVLAEKYGIKVWQPEKLTLEDWKHEVGNIEFAIVAAYAKIIKKDILDTAPKGFVGVHPSLLPKYRGATPIQSALLHGEKETGVTLYFVDEFIDHGPMIARETCPLSDEETYSSLFPKLALIGGKLLVEILPELSSGHVRSEPQSDADATFTKKFKTEDGFVDIEKDDPKIVYRKIKALNPEPGVYMFLNGKRIKLLEAETKNGATTITRTQTEGETPKPANLALT